MGNANALKHIFSKLDRDGNGKITLSELYLNSEEANEVVSVCSLPTLFHFDVNREGFLNFREFVEMENFVAKVQKQVTKSQKSKALESEATVYKIRSEDSTGAHHALSRGCATPVDSAAAHPLQPLQLQQLGSTGAAADASGNSSGNIGIGSSSSGNSNSNRSIPRFDSKREGGMKRTQSDDNLLVQQEVRKQISIELLPSLHKEMYGRQGRQCFLEWLFKLCDISKTGYITKDELHLFLTAIQHDNIDLESLVFSDDEEKKKQSVVQRIMKEYDTDNLGVLSKDEFLKLADVVVNKYEARHNLIENKEEQIVGEWILGRALGEGAYGIVKLATHAETNAKRAAKRIKKGNVSDMSKLDVEIEAMKILEHPNVVRLYEVIDDQNFIYLVMELCGGGSLYEYLKEKQFDEDVARYYFTVLIDGVSYCHEKGICHRDLRLENLLLDNFGNLKISDFGHAGIFKKGWDLFSTQLVGSLYHLSPEQINGKVYSGEKIDLWGAGIILYCFLTARLPFCSSAVVEMFEDIKAARFTYPDDVPVSDNAKDLIEKLLRSNPEERLSIQHIRQHPWMQGPTKKPQLLIHQLKINIANTSQTRELISTSIEEILANHNISVINSYDPETGAKNSAIFLTATIIPPQQIACAFKCIHAQNNVKFFVFIGFTSDSTLCVETQLKEGEVKTYNEVVHQINKSFQKDLSHYVQEQRCVSPIM